MRTDLSRTPADESRRLASLDAYRGAVILLLIPNVYGGFSFFEMARADPGNAIWSFLARQFTHAEWTGCTVWDLIQPSFLFVIGVAMPFSYAARERRGESERRILMHAVLRAVALVLLGLFLMRSARTYWDLVWPMLLLSLGLPVSRMIATIFHGVTAGAERVIELLWWGSVLAASLIRLVVTIDDFGGLIFHGILTQIGLAYVFAFLVVKRGFFVQALVASAILVAYWAAFLAYPLPAPGFDLSRAGVLPTDEVFEGYFAHWNKNTNLAAAFDVWFLNLLPRPEPFLFNEHGYQTLNFVPSIATMIFGVMAGDYLRSGRTQLALRNGLLRAGVLALGAGLVAGWVLCPLVKSIWTPSWTIFSAGLCLILLAAFYHAIDVRGHRGWAFPFVVAGTNAIFLYTLAQGYRWVVLGLFTRAFGATLFSGYWGPVLESLAFGLSAWLLAFALYRLRIFIRL